MAKSADPFIFFFAKITSWIIERKVLEMTKNYIVTHTWWSISGYDDYEWNEDEPLAFTSRELAEAYIEEGKQIRRYNASC